MILKLISKLFPKKVKPYPSDFALIDYSGQAFSEGIKDKRNKIIIRYHSNKYGSTVRKKYVYSEERVYSLKQIYNIPIIDLTKVKNHYPIHYNINLADIEYTKV